MNAKTTPKPKHLHQHIIYKIQKIKSEEKLFKNPEGQTPLPIGERDKNYNEFLKTMQVKREFSEIFSVERKNTNLEK